MLSTQKHLHIWQCIRGPFLFPPKFEGHKCEWERFSYTQAGCLLCGAEHRCGEHGDCEEEKTDEGHTTCRITGCVVREQDFKDEWGSLTRACVPCGTKAKSTQAADTTHGTQTRPHPAPTRHTPCDTRTFVNHIVTELLDSGTTRKCRHIENKRFFQTQINTFHRELKNHHPGKQLNMMKAVTEVAWSVRKMRRPASLPDNEMQALISQCTDAITAVMLRYNFSNAVKLINNEVRRREFACSMLYLMRSGVDCRGQCVLPKLHLITVLLPLESFLPDHYGIRSKSITEGENLLKMEIRRVFSMT